MIMCMVYHWLEFRYLSGQGSGDFVRNSSRRNCRIVFLVILRIAAARSDVTLNDHAITKSAKKNVLCKGHAQYTSARTPMFPDDYIDLT